MEHVISKLCFLYNRLRLKEDILFYLENMNKVTVQVFLID